MASEQAAQIGARLRGRREELGLTRRQLSRKMEGLATDNDLYRWESGKHKPQDDTLAAIADALGRDYAWAMGLSPNGSAPDLVEALDGEASQLDLIQQQIRVLTELLEAFRVEAAGSVLEVTKRLDAMQGQASRPPRRRRQ